jgi:hypothetical protein
MPPWWRPWRAAELPLGVLWSTDHRLQMNRLVQNVDRWIHIGLLIGTVNADEDAVVTSMMPEAGAQDAPVPDLDLGAAAAARVQVKNVHDVVHEKLIVAGNAGNVLIYTLLLIAKGESLIDSLGTLMILTFKISQVPVPVSPLYHLLLHMRVIHTDHQAPIMDEPHDHTRGRRTEEEINRTKIVNLQYFSHKYIKISYQKICLVACKPLQQMALFSNSRQENWIEMVKCLSLTNVKDL